MYLVLKTDIYRNSHYCIYFNYPVATECLVGVARYVALVTFCIYNHNIVVPSPRP